MDDADHRPTVGDQRDRHADDGEAVHEVGGAVERVDEPPDVGALAAGLLAEERELGCGVVQELADRVLARRVGVAHPVARPLRAHVARATEGVEHDRSAGRGRASRGDEQPVEVEIDRHRPVPPCSCSSSSFVPAATSCRRASASSATEVAAVGVDDERARFLAHEQPAEVVPRRVLVGMTVEVTVEMTRGDVAQRERGRAEGAELAPSERHAEATPTSATTARAMSVVGGRCDGVAGRAGRRRPAPRCSARRWLRSATSAHHGPSASSAHSEIAQYGMPRAQLVDPSTGSSTTVSSASTGPVQPDSSLSTRRPAACSTGSTAASATRSRRYWPGRSVRARRSVAAERGERAALRRGGDVEHGEEIVGRHRGAASTVTTAL